MIDSVQRMYASVVAEGRFEAAGASDVHEKAMIYGELAKILSHISLSEVSLDMSDHVSETMFGIQSALTRLLMSQCVNAQYGDTKTLAGLLRERAITRGDTPASFPIIERLRAGVTTALTAEILTLHTIQKHTYLDAMPITRKGLMASQRVPFKLAMLHLASLGSIGNYTDYMDFPNGERGRVFKDEHVSFDADKGLILHVDVTRRDYGQASINEPQIGCPATLVTGFVRDLHAIASEAAVQSRLIPLSA